MARGRKPKSQVNLEDSLKEIRQELVDNTVFKNWDIAKGERIEYFDPTPPPPPTHYRPIDEERGFDFDPEWFTEVRNTFKRTGHYCAYPKKTKAYSDFWTREYQRCRDGLTVNGYTITGDNYFFLNYY